MYKSRIKKHIYRYVDMCSFKIALLGSPRKLSGYDKSDRRTRVVNNVIFADIFTQHPINNTQRPGVKGVVGCVG